MANSVFWKLSLITGIILSLVAFVLGWIGFGVPDWQQLQRYNGSTVEYFGLWAYCQEQGPVLGTICKRWPTAEDELFNGSRPEFVRTAEGLITTGMILLSLGLAIAIVAAALPYLAFLAALLALLAFIFLVIGLPIFGRQSNSFSSARGDATYNKRYGFWLIVPTIVLEFLAILFFLGAGLLYRLFGYGNLATSLRNKPAGPANQRMNFGNTVYGGRQMLGPPNILYPPPPVNIPYGGPSPGNIPYGGPSPVFFSGGGMPSSPYSPLQSQTIPSLLSEYLAQRAPQVYGPTVVRSSGLSVLPQPSMIRSITATPIPNVTPAYLRFGEPAGPPFTPIINLSGETIIGPIQRIS